MSRCGRHLWIGGLVWLIWHPPLWAVEAGFVEDFSAGTAGWTGAEPAVEPSGGPAGDGDGFLRIEARGANGPGSRLAVYNNSPNWTGDFAAAGITSVDLDIMNLETSPAPMSMRLVLFGPNATSNRWTSIEPIVIANDGQWQRISFPVDSEAITRVQGGASYDGMIENVVRLMIRHDANTPSATGTTIVGQIGIDNITLVGPSVSGRGDFNNDGVVDVVDVDLLLAEVKSGANSASFDLTDDGLVNELDIEYIVTEPTELNSYIGDANLDGEFNTGDLVATLGAGQYEDAVAMNSTWATGDWNGDAEFSTSDLIFALQGGGYEQGPRQAVRAAPVPEPAGCVLFALGTIFLRRRR